MSAKPTHHTDNPIKASIHPTTVKISAVDTVQAFDDITIVIENTGPDVYLKNIQIDLPVGDESNKLVLENTEEEIKPDTGQPELWKIDKKGTKAHFEVKPKESGVTKVLLRTGGSFNFILKHVIFNFKEGVAPVIVKLAIDPDTNLEYSLDIKKVINTEAKFTFTIDKMNIEPGTACNLAWDGEFIDVYTLSQSTGTDKIEYKKPGGLQTNPTRTTIYTMDAKSKDTNLQIQRTVNVLNPLLKDFKVSATAVDKGQSVELTWATEFAMEVKLECSDKSIDLHNPNPKQAPDPASTPPLKKVIIGPINKPVTITAWAVKGNIDSERVHHHVAMNPPLIESFTVTAQPLEANKKCRFMLQWRLKNAGSFEIIEKNGHTQDTKLPIPAEATAFEVAPAYERTTYELKVFEIAKPKKGETIEE